eukprot:764232-Hanusia_phi.AAC.2
MVVSRIRSDQVAHGTSESSVLRLLIAKQVEPDPESRSPGPIQPGPNLKFPGPESESPGTTSTRLRGSDALFREYHHGGPWQAVAHAGTRQSSAGHSLLTVSRSSHTGPAVQP